MNIQVSVSCNAGKKIFDARLERLPGAVMRYRARFVNSGKETLKLDHFRFSGFEFAGKGPDLRVYREGWTAVSAIATLRYGECNLRANPDYLPFAVSEPECYTSEKPNVFSAENAVVLNDRKTGFSMLAGFVTTGRFYNRFQIELDESGLKVLDAYVLGDGREVDPGEEIVSEEFIVLEGNDGYPLLERYAELWAEAMHARKWDHIPTGWCSWYYYFSKITEQDVQENLEYLKAHKAEYPLEYFQIDDGYQRTPGDWTQPSPQFPNGIEHAVKMIASYGFKPGLWFAPFMVCSDSELYRKHPEYLLHDAEGKILHPIKWRGSDAAFLDCTRTDVQEHLTNLFRQVRSWGCVYIKLDFMMYESCVKGAVYSDRKATRCEAFRRGMLAIRKGIGEDAFILGGTIIVGPCVGIVNGSRYSTDITPYWGDPQNCGKEAPVVPHVVRNLILRRYMHWRLWVNDPDVHIARKDNNKLTETEVQFWTDALYMAGGSLLLADRLSTLAPERAELSQFLMKDPDALQDVRPEDFFEREIPRVWSGIRKRDGKSVLGLFNPDDEPCVIRVDMRDLHVPNGGSWISFRGGKKVAAESGILEYPLKPHTSMLFEAE